MSQLLRTDKLWGQLGVSGVGIDALSIGGSGARAVAWEPDH